MNVIRKASLALALLLVSGLALPSSAFADNITLYNTGVDGAGVVLITGAVDPHYTLLSVPDDIGNHTARVEPNIPATWIPNSSTSQWIGATLGNGIYQESGFYYYQTTFDLTGLDPATVLITGRLAGASSGGAVSLNNPTPLFPTNYSQGGNSPSAFTSFTFNSGFVSGLNTLNFVAFNNVSTSLPGPNGLRVEVSGTARRLAPAVPEPSAVASMGLGSVGLLGLLLRARKRCPAA